MSDTAVYFAGRADSAAAFTRFCRETDGAAIRMRPWGGDYAPQAAAYVCADFRSAALRVALCATEPRAQVRAAVFSMNGPVYEDSCLEFFFSPDPDPACRDYLNFEANSNGFLLCGTHVGGADGRAGSDPAEFHLSVRKRFLPDGLLRWSVCYRIPFAYIQTYFPRFHPAPGMLLRGNFYKCGDLCPTPHYLAWAPIRHPAPQFHLPEFFGQLRFPG